MLHVWWTCLIIKRLWSRVYEVIAAVLKCTLPLDPLEAHLNKPPAGLSKSERALLRFLFNATKQEIASSLKQPFPKYSGVLNRMIGMMVNKKLSALDIDKHDKYLQVWDFWVRFASPNST